MPGQCVRLHIGHGNILVMATCFSYGTVLVIAAYCLLTGGSPSLDHVLLSPPCNSGVGCL